MLSTAKRVVVLLALGSAAVIGCSKSSAVSAEKASEHVAFLAKAVETDLAEVRTGMPKGAELLKGYFDAGEFQDATAARDQLERTRSKVQDLRIAKSTFFALVDTKGGVMRSDQEHDALAGKNLSQAFPELSRALEGSYVETRGAMDEAAGVRGRKDAQWLAVQPVGAAGAVKGLYVTGWSFSAYAYRLENQLRSQVRAGVEGVEKEGKEPLVYVFVVVDGKAFGAPITPEVNAQAIERQPFIKTDAKTPAKVELEITGRDFGAAFLSTPGLGKGTGIAVLRSET
jgi:hypothetical protein